MLPWETRDTEREILVEECKEAILLLSSREDTFLGPFEMPALPKTNDDDEEEDEEQSVAEAGPSEESLEKLAKLEPLPPLLADFDLDAHVGLIQRLLEVDENLVEQQSKLSGMCSVCVCRMSLIIHSLTTALIVLHRRRRSRTNLLEKLLFSLCLYTI